MANYTLKNGEVYFGGDVFERGIPVVGELSYDAAIDNDYTTSKCATLINPGTVSFTCANANYNEDILNCLTGYANNAVCTKADVSIDIDTITDRITQLQKQIDDLKKKPCAAQGLRSALKTLKYERELE